MTTLINNRALDRLRDLAQARAPHIQIDTVRDQVLDDLITEHPQLEQGGTAIDLRVTLGRRDLTLVVVGGTDLDASSTQALLALAKCVEFVDISDRNGHRQIASGFAPSTNS